MYTVLFLVGIGLLVSGIWLIVRILNESRRLRQNQQARGNDRINPAEPGGAP